MTDAHQFEAFMRNYQNMVFSTAMRLLANQTEAEDVAQEVFFAILFLAEKLALRQYFGVVLTLAGVYLLILKGKK